LNGGGAEVEEGVREEECGHADGRQHHEHPADAEWTARALQRTIFTK
jgi:hypothetical protein